jgi:hypothetical protein
MDAFVTAFWRRWAAKSSAPVSSRDNNPISDIISSLAIYITNPFITHYTLFWRSRQISLFAYFGNCISLEDMLSYYRTTLVFVNQFEIAHKIARIALLLRKTHRKLYAISAKFCLDDTRFHERGKNTARNTAQKRKEKMVFIAMKTSPTWPAEYVIVNLL